MTFVAGLFLLGIGVFTYRNRRSLTKMNPFLGDDETSFVWRFGFAMNTVGSMIFVAAGIGFIAGSVVSAISALLDGA